MTEQERAELKREILDELLSSGRLVTRDYCDHEMKAQREDISDIKTSVAVLCTKVSSSLTVQKITATAIIGAIVTAIAYVIVHAGG